MPPESAPPATVSDWRALAACRGMDTRLFYPAGTADYNNAVAVCAGCPVRARCLDFAIRDEHGIWGGTGEEERKRIRRRRRVGRKPTDHGLYNGHTTPARPPAAKAPRQAYDELTDAGWCHGCAAPGTLKAGDVTHHCIGRYCACPRCHQEG